VLATTKDNPKSLSFVSRLTKKRAKIELSSVGTKAPTTRLRPELIARAAAEGTKFNASTAALTLSRVLLDTKSGLLSTRLTVATDTLAVRATSLRFERFLLISFPLILREGRFRENLSEIVTSLLTDVTSQMNSVTSYI